MSGVRISDGSPERLVRYRRGVFDLTAKRALSFESARYCYSVRLASIAFFSVLFNDPDDDYNDHDYYDYYKQPDEYAQSERLRAEVADRAFVVHTARVAVVVRRCADPYIVGAERDYL